MQQAIKTLVIFCLIISITPTRLSTKNKGIGDFFSMIGDKLDEIASKIAKYILAAVLGTINFSICVTEVIAEFNIFSVSDYKAFIGLVFLPVGIINLVIMLLQTGTKTLLENLKDKLDYHINAIEAKKIKYENAARKINAAVDKKTEELQEIIRNR